MNLATSMRTVWTYKPGSIISLASVDASGRPTVTLLDPPDYVSGTTERLVAPGTADFVYTDLDHWSVQADGNRLWFGNDRGVYLYTPAAGMQRCSRCRPTMASTSQPSRPSAARHTR